MLDVPPASAAYVGDGPSDVHVARSCGALAVAVGWGHQFHEGDSDVVVRSPSELLDLFNVSRAISGGAR
jgi:phosphoglycolate phosphatase-like HAD superfamily hydrolase